MTDYEAALMRVRAFVNVCNTNDTGDVLAECEGFFHTQVLKLSDLEILVGALDKTPDRMNKETSIVVSDGEVLDMFHAPEKASGVVTNTRCPQNPNGLHNPVGYLIPEGEVPYCVNCGADLTNRR